MDAIKVYARSAKKLGLKFRPKSHDVHHLSHQIYFFGPIAAIGAWKDEQMNGRLRPIVQASYRSNWHARVLSEGKRGLSFAKI